MKVECIWEGPAGLGEGPLWHPEERVLYWIDIAKPGIHRLDPRNGTHQHWSMPKVIGAIVPCQRGGLMATVGNQVVHVNLLSGKLTECVDLFPAERNDVRANDGKCDRHGRFWIGIASFDVENPQGGLLRLDPDGTLTEMEKHITISNGLGWSPDNKTFYYTDSLRHSVYRYDFDLESGAISNRSLFYSTEQVEPDGLAVDAEGYVWQAQWNGSQVIRYAPDGQVDRVIEMPVQRPTSCMFGGDNFDTLYVTSCSRSIGETETLPPPAGGVFAIQVGVQGLPETSFP